ncbi:Hok/Gef family protein [Vibrio parahaemolyticus]|nr:Hok/Gef family protein [Vibrio parahaemolyticus]
MPKSTIAFASLVVVSLTLLCSLWIVRHSLCDVHYLDETGTSPPDLVL